MQEMRASFEEKQNLGEMLRFVWARQFSLPPNDARLLQATAQEALEQINGLRALEAMARSATPVIADADDDASPKSQFMGGQILDDEGNVSTPGPKRGRMTTVTGPAAEKIADKPHLTAGTKHYWAEWDELELAETDPSKEPLRIQW